MIPLNGFTCFLSAAALYILSRITGRDAEMLKSVTNVCQLKDLADLVEVESKVMVAVSGRVGSETPLKPQLSGIDCVFVEETVEQLFLKRNWKFLWVQGNAWLQPICKEVPWYLDDGTGRVNVSGAQGATGFVLTVGSEVFEKAEPPSFVRGTLEILQGLKMLGVKRIEHVLPTGTPLTVVGEAVKDGTGDFRIQKPEIGPFYVSPIPINQIIPKWEDLSRKIKHASIGLTVLGVILISKPVMEYVLGRIIVIVERIGDAREKRRQRRIRQRVVDAEARRMNRVTRGLERQNKNGSDGTSRDDEAPDLCKICFSQKYNAAFIPCGHMCCCMTCASKLKFCPLCRKPIVQVLKIYCS